MTEVVQHPLHSAAQWYALMARNGITSTSDMAYESSTLGGYEALASMADCPLRLSLYHMSTQSDAGDKLPAGPPDPLTRKQGIKLWADGSPWVGTAALSFPYLDSAVVNAAGIPIGPSSEGALNYTRSELDAILDRTPSGLADVVPCQRRRRHRRRLDAYEHASCTPHGHRPPLAMEHCGAGRRTSTNGRPRWAWSCPRGRSSSSTGATCSTASCSRPRSARSGWASRTPSTPG